MSFSIGISDLIDLYDHFSNADKWHGSRVAKPLLPIAASIDSHDTDYEHYDGAKIHALYGRVEEVAILRSSWPEVGANGPYEVDRIDLEVFAAAVSGDGHSRYGGAIVRYVAHRETGEHKDGATYTHSVDEIARTEWCGWHTKKATIDHLQDRVESNHIDRYNEWNA